MAGSKLGMEAAMATVLEALANPVRIRILRSLLECSCCQCDLASRLDKHPVYISRHLAVLSRAGLVTISKEGTRTFPKPAHPEIRQILDLAERLVQRSASEKAKEARALRVRPLRVAPTQG